MGEQGAVDLKLCIDKRGLVETIHLTKSSGYQKLDQSAIETVKTWRFTALETGVETALNCYHLPIHFTLQA
jgi:protein TonB